MTISPEDDFAAAEYALGTLDAGERATLAARRLREPELDEAIRAWEERLAPLAEAAPEIEPPRDLLPAIEARIRAASPEAPTNAGGCRASSAASRAGVRRRSPHRSSPACSRSASSRARRPGSPLPREYVAILQKDAASPAFEVTVNLDRRELTVRPVAARAPPGKSYELWIIDAKLGAPRSLGVIGDGAARRELAAYEPAVVAGRDLCRDGRAAGRLARRQALRAAGVRRQADPGRPLKGAGRGGGDRSRSPLAGRRLKPHFPSHQIFAQLFDAIGRARVSRFWTTSLPFISGSRGSVAALRRCGWR